MGNFLGWDSPFMEYLEKIMDIIILSVLWLMCCIPFFTMGTSTTAIYYVMINKVNKKDIYVFKNFFISFKDNFKQTILIDIVTKVFIAIILVNLYIISGYLVVAEPIKVILSCVQLVLLIEVVFVSTYLYAIIAKIKMSSKEALKLAFVLSHKHVFTTIAIILVAVILVAIFFMLGNLLYMLIAPGIYFLISSFLLVRVFRKYSEGFEKQEDIQFENGEL